MPYLFKDTERAARRLQIVVDVFAFSSRPFLQTVDGAAPEVAVDLGCGPGHSTGLLAEVARGARPIGLGSPQHFLAQVRRTPPVLLPFYRHDVTVVSFLVE